MSKTGKISLPMSFICQDVVDGPMYLRISVTDLAKVLDLGVKDFAQVAGLGKITGFRGEEETQELIVEFADLKPEESV